MRALPILVAWAILGSGCVKSMLINGQIEGTREASIAFDRLGDYETAGLAAPGALVQFEGMLTLSPDNEDAMFLLTKGWTGYAYGFIEDEMELAEDNGQRELAEHHKKRATQAYARAVSSGLQLVERRALGFADAKKTEASLDLWLTQFFVSPQDAETLFWTGYAWLGRANLNKDDAELVAELFVGIALIRRSVAIDPNYYNAAGHALLGAYYARSAMAELDQAQAAFETAMAKTSRKSLIILFNYATRYACARADNVLYTQVLKEILANEEEPVDLRLTNAIARRRAARWLGEKRMFDACGIDPVTVTGARAGEAVSPTDPS